MSVINKIGRRKTAVARIYLEEGNGEITVNKKPVNEYFPLQTLQYIIQQPLKLTETAGKYNIKANLDGGGIRGQAEALRMAIARALVEIDEQYRPILKSHELLRRDPRMVERKKPGRPKARKRFQFSKR